MVPSPPGNFGQRLLPTRIDEIARDDPTRILYSIATKDVAADGFQDIDARTFAQAVDRCAWHLDKTLGRGNDFPTLLYMGPQDLVYAILVIASIKTGYKLLLSSPRNTLEAHISLLEKTQCSTMLLPPIFPLPIIKQIQAARTMEVVEIPGAQHWLTSEPAVSYPYTKTYAEARLDPWAVLHTSGSTGVPKPIVQTHATYSPIDAYTALSGSQATYLALVKGQRIYLGFPLFHCAGISLLLPGCIFAECTIVLGPFPPSVETVNAIIQHGNVQDGCMAPSLLVDIARSPEYLENLGRLERISYGGGSLPEVIGDLIGSKTRLVNSLGSTEAGILPFRLCDPEDWAYMSFHPALGQEFRPYSVSEGLYEHVIVRSPDPDLQLYQPIFGTFPELQEWSMRDLYSKHPTKDDVWLYRGRTDDIIVFSTGEKLNPLDMESTMEAHPAVSGVVVCGAGRFQSSLLVEATDPPPQTDATQRSRVLDDIWPIIHSANKAAPSHGRIHRDMVIFTSSDKPMLRAGKGTVQRKATVDLYAAELDALYEGNTAPTLAPRRAYSDAADAVKGILGVVTDIDIADLSAHSDLFELGLDSLQASAISKEINKYLVSLGKPPAMKTSLVYSNSHREGLVSVVTALAEGKNLEHGSSVAEKMEKLYELHMRAFPENTVPTRKDGTVPVILLTGSTGSLGSYVLDALIRENRVAHIYCLNRGPGSAERQRRSFSAKGLPELNGKVITCLDADLSQDRFGLSDETYDTLVQEVTHIIHNAWQVDFNLGLDSFSGQVGNVRRLVDFSIQSRAQVFFISSISAVASCTAEVVPERMLDDWSVAHKFGYGQSKLVSERILDDAVKVAGIVATVCRVGQIAGPTTSDGVWPKQEWLPSLIATSRYLGKLPASLGSMDDVDWIPVDILARIVVELAIGDATAGKKLGTGASVYHAINPKRTTWAKLVGVVSRSLNSGGGAVETVSLESWLEALRASASQEADLTLNPAVKILDFYDGLVAGKELRFETKKAVQSSPTLASLDSVQEVWMENWIKQWSF